MSLALLCEFCCFSVSLIAMSLWVRNVLLRVSLYYHQLCCVAKNFCCLPCIMLIACCECRCCAASPIALSRDYALLFWHEIWFCSYSLATVTMAMYIREQSRWLGWGLDEFQENRRTARGLPLAFKSWSRRYIPGPSQGSIEQEIHR